jgi:uncharacterized protein (DUF983 family)
MTEYTIPAPAAEALPPREIKTSLLRGWCQKCPACGKGAIYGKYLKVAHACPACGEELHHQRADDAPPYFTMVIVAHVVVAGLLIVEKAFAPPTWVQLSIWLPLVVIMSLWLLPRVKGTLIGLQWALRMHGFGGETDQADTFDHPPR